jgi:hypothetical protein
MKVMMDVIEHPVRKKRIAEAKSKVLQSLCGINLPRSLSRQAWRTAHDSIGPRGGDPRVRCGGSEAGSCFPPEIAERRSERGVGSGDGAV